MPKTYLQIQKEIEKLQQQAESLRSREVEGVISRIREAIDQYGLTAADLFGKAAAPRAARKGRKAPAQARRGKSAAVKYRDEAGNTWGGRGPRPRWFSAALAAGRTPEELLAK